jgi:hypothetical protein
MRYLIYDAVFFLNYTQQFLWEQRDFLKSDKKRAMPAAGVAIAKPKVQ